MAVSDVLDTISAKWSPVYMDIPISVFELLIGNFILNLRVILRSTALQGWNKQSKLEAFPFQIWAVAPLLKLPCQIEK